MSFDSWSKTNFSDIIIQMQNGLSKRNGESGLLYGVLRLANINEYSINLNDLRYQEPLKENLHLLNFDYLTVKNLFGGYISSRFLI